MAGTNLIVFGVAIVPILIMAVFLLNGKGAFLIAGYNTLSITEKAKYNEKALCRFVGWLLIVVSFCMMLIPTGTYFDIEWLSYCGFALILTVSIGGVIYANTRSRFRNNSSVNTTENLKYAKTTIVAVIALSSIVVIAVGILIYNGGKDPAVNISDNKIQINAMYGLSIDFSEVTDITLIEKSISNLGIGTRISGYGGIGESLKGHFKSDNLGEILLFVQSKSSPTIRIERIGKKDIYISFRDSDTTGQVYHEMIANVPVK